MQIELGTGVKQRCTEILYRKCKEANGNLIYTHQQPSITQVTITMEAVHEISVNAFIHSFLLGFTKSCTHNNVTFTLTMVRLSRVTDHTASFHHLHIFTVSGGVQTAVSVYPL